MDGEAGAGGGRGDRLDDDFVAGQRPAGKVVLLAESKALLVDRVQRHTGPWQARPVKRVYIPKKGSAGKRRPLGIPTDPANCEVAPSA